MPSRKVAVKGADPLNDEMVNPYGGVEDSGLGGVEASFESFTEVQWVTLRSELADYPF